MFYRTVKTGNNHVTLPELYSNGVKLGKNFFEKLHGRSRRINAILSERGPSYIFEAHVFTQVMVAMGINQSNIISILDNNQSKHDLRLLGTELFVKPLDVVRYLESPTVIITDSSHTQEIVAQLRGINSSVLTEIV
jgi:hypothetical protein